MYKIRVALGPLEKLSQDRKLILDTLEACLSDSKCNSLDYTNMMKLFRISNLHLEEVANVFAKYFDKFDQRFDFQLRDIDHLTRYFKLYNNSKIAIATLKKISDRFNSIIDSSDKQFLTSYLH